MSRSFAILCLLPLLFAVPMLATEGEPEAPITTLQIGDSIPEVDFRLADGTPITRDDLLGRYSVLDFWATWCAPCITSFPHLNELQEEFADRPIDFYSITYEPESKFRSVLDENPLETAVCIDNDFATFVAFRAWGIPAAYVVNPEGVVVSVVGPWELTTEVVETILAGGIPDVEQNRGWPDPAGAEEHFRSTLNAN